MMCEVCSKTMNLENMKEHKKSCVASSSSIAGSADKIEINKLKNKVACLEGQLSSKSNECKMVVQQRNQLNEEIEKLKQEKEEKVKDTLVPITPTPNNPTGFQSRFLKSARYEAFGKEGPSFSRSKSPLSATDSSELAVSEPKIKYVTDPSLLAQVSELEAQLTTQKTRLERQINNMKEDFEFQQGRNDRKIVQLTEELAEKEEEMLNLQQNASLSNRNTNLMEISGLSDISGLSGFITSRPKSRPATQSQKSSSNGNCKMQTQTSEGDMGDGLEDGKGNKSQGQSFRNEFLQQSIPVGGESSSMMYNPMGGSDGTQEELTTSAYTTELNQVKAVLESVSEENVKLQRQINENGKSVNNVGRQITDKNDEIDRLKATVKRLEGQRDGVFNDLLNMQKEKSAAKNEQVVLSKNIEEMKHTHLQELKKLKDQIKQKQWLIDDNEIFVDNYKLEISRLKAKITRLQEEIDNMRSQISRSRINRIDLDLDDE